MANRRLIDFVRTHGLYIQTPHGIVNASSTAIVWGEGPNVRGFHWAKGAITAEHCVSQKELKILEREPDLAPDYPGLWILAQEWAEHQTETD